MAGHWIPKFYMRRRGFLVPAVFEGQSPFSDRLTKNARETLKDFVPYPKANEKPSYKRVVVRYLKRNEHQVTGHKYDRVDRWRLPDKR